MISSHGVLFGLDNRKYALSNPVNLSLHSIYMPPSMQEQRYLNALFNRAVIEFQYPNRAQWDRLVADKFTIGELRRINPYDDPPGTYDYIFHDGDTEEVRRQTPRPANWLDIYSSPPEN